MPIGPPQHRRNRIFLEVIAKRTYRHLLLAQVIALLGTGLATVASGLLAYDLAGGNAGVVLGTALAIKMVAYVGIAPVASFARSRATSASIGPILAARRVDHRIELDPGSGRQGPGVPHAALDDLP